MGQSLNKCNYALKKDGGRQKDGQDRLTKSLIEELRSLKEIHIFRLMINKIGYEFLEVFSFRQTDI